MSTNLEPRGIILEPPGVILNSRVAEIGVRVAPRVPASTRTPNFQLLLVPAWEP
jgi:hypothetical protein